MIAAQGILTARGGKTNHAWTHFRAGLGRLQAQWDSCTGTVRARVLEAGLAWLDPIIEERVTQLEVDTFVGCYRELQGCESFVVEVGKLADGLRLVKHAVSVL